MPVRSLTSRVLEWPDAAAVGAAVAAWAARCAKDRNDVVQIGYFGSYARGNWGVGSDVDLVIVVKGSARPFELRAAEWDATRLPVPADLLIYTLDEWERLKEGQSTFYDTVTQEAVWVYPGEDASKSANHSADPEHPLPLKETMTSETPDATAPPQISLEQASRRRGAEPGLWLIVWQIRNVGAEPLTLDTAWLPHGQFRGERTELRPTPTLQPGQATDLELSVRWDEPVGSVVENAFLILTVRWRDEPWRILARITVRADLEGGPLAKTETMTIQAVGFSQRQEPSIE